MSKPREALNKAIDDAGFLIDDLTELNKGAPATVSMLVLPEIGKAVEIKGRLEMLRAALDSDMGGDDGG